MTSSQRVTQPDLDDRIERWRYRSATTDELRGALAIARPGVGVPVSWRRPELITACRTAGVDDPRRPVSRRSWRR